MALRQYFDLQSSPTGPNQSRLDMGLLKNDRVLEYLIKRMTSTFPEPGCSSTGPRLTSTRMLRPRESSARNEIRIGFVGPSCSGKTSLIQAYTSVCSGVQSSGFSPMFSPNRKPLDNEVDDRQGAISLNGVTFEVQLDNGRCLLAHNSFHPLMTVMMTSWLWSGKTRRMQCADCPMNMRGVHREPRCPSGGTSRLSILGS